MRTLLLICLVACAVEPTEPEPRVQCEQHDWSGTTIAWCDAECTVEPALDAVQCTYINEDGRVVTQAGSFVAATGERGYCAFARATMSTFRPIEIKFYACEDVDTSACNRAGECD